MSRRRGLRVWVAGKMKDVLAGEVSASRSGFNSRSRQSECVSRSPCGVTARDECAKRSRGRGWRAEDEGWAYSAIGDYAVS